MKLLLVSLFIFVIATPLSLARSTNSWVVLKQTPFFEGGWAVPNASALELMAQTQVYLKQLHASTVSAYQKGEITKILADWESYGCQVIGYTKNGKKFIELNFFPLNIGSYNWHANYVVVDDGGYSFWRVEYDLQKKTFFQFSSNGYA